MIRQLSHLLSFIFSPLLVPTYAVWTACHISVMALLPASSTIVVVATVFGLTCLFPLIAIAVMYKLGMVSDPGLNKRGERTVPFVISAVAYILMLVFFRHIHAPGWMTMFAVGALVAVVICCLINFKWKISVHLTALGGFVGLLLHLILAGEAIFNPVPWLMAAVIATGATASARLILRRHTLGQVVAGTLNGVICVYLFTLI